MRRILAIIGSPRKGETLKAARRLEEEMKKLGETEFEYVMLSDLALRDCLGCHGCIFHGENTCREAEKLQNVLEKMKTADAVLLASPTYNQGVTALMKKFLDYHTYLWHRPALFGVRFFGLATGGGMFAGVFKTLKMNVSSWGGFWAGSLGVPHYESLTPKFRAKLDKSFARQAAVLLKAAADKSLPRPKLGQLMSFRMWRMNAALAFSASDREVWEARGWLNKKCRYYYSTKINPLSNAAAACAIGLARRFMRSVYVGY